MRISTLLVLCALIVAATAQTFSISSPSGSTVTVGVMTDWFFVTASVNPNVSVSVNIAEATGNIEQLSSSSLAFSTQTRQLSFRFVPKVTGIITLDLSLSSTDQFTIPATFAIMSAPRPIYFDGWSTLSSLPMGYPSEPMKVYIETPFTSAISVTPSFTVYISGESVPLTVQPSTITIPAGSLSASFRIIAGYTEFGNNVQVDWGTISGDSNDWYVIQNDIISMNFYRRSAPSRSAFSSNFLVGTESNILYFYTPGDRPNDTLTITPQAADTTFSPSSVSLDATTQVAQFTILTTSTEPNKPVYFYLSSPAAGYYNRITGAGTLNTPQRQFEIDVPSFFFVTKPAKMSIKVEYPVPADVTIEFYAANLAFEPASISFTSAGETAFDVAITPFHTGNDIISFKVTGTNAAWFTTPGDINVGIYGGSITGPDTWYVPALFVGQESDRLPMRLNFAPATDIVVTPTAPDFVFNPPNFTFTPNTVSTYFTVTPTVARSTVPVSFIVSGTDWAWFAPPNPTFLTSNLRILQAEWSSDLERGDKSVLYAGTSHTVWVSTNYVGRSDSFTVTPVSSFFKFSPEVLNFNSGTSRSSFSATPIAGNMDIGSATITYVVSGQAAGYYESLAPQAYRISLRPFVFYSAVLSWDTRNPIGTYINASQYSVTDIRNALNQNHVHSFSIATDAFPNSKLTITPKSNHISFSPSSVTLTPSSVTTVWQDREVQVGSSYIDIPTPTYLAIANFSVTGHAAGSHDVWFELSNDDAGYYAAPQHTRVQIYKYSGGGSASSTVVASIGMIIASVVLALFL